MSLQQAQAFIEKMKADSVFSKAILDAGDIGERLAIARTEGVPCSIEDIESLQYVCIEPTGQSNNLPLSYQCKGPCHTKCAAVVA